MAWLDWLRTDERNSNQDEEVDRSTEAGTEDADTHVDPPGRGGVEERVEDDLGDQVKSSRGTLKRVCKTWEVVRVVR